MTAAYYCPIQLVSAEPHHVLVGGADNIPHHHRSDRNSSQRNIPTSAIKSEEGLQTAKLETRKVGSFVAVCSIAAQALNSSTNHLEFKAQCHTPEPGT